MGLPSFRPVRAPQWTLNYAGVNISADISDAVVSINYVDYLSEFSSEVQIAMEDHRRLWQGAWRPVPGDRLNLMIGYRNETMLPCGDFQVDELELSGEPDTFRLRGLAAYITPAMRTANSAGYENQTLLGIAASIAGKYGLTLLAAAGTPDVGFARVTQKHESDLAFLKRLAQEYDYDFSVRGATLVFYARRVLEQAPSVATLTRSDLEQFEFRTRTYRTYRAAQITHQDPETKALISQVQADPNAPGGDSLRLVSRCENVEQALIKAKAALHGHNMLADEATITAPGSAIFAAGNNLAIKGFGQFDGVYLIRCAGHHIERSSGYSSQLEMRRVA